MQLDTNATEALGNWFFKKPLITNSLNGYQGWQDEHKVWVYIGSWQPERNLDTIGIFTERILRECDESTQPDKLGFDSTFHNKRNQLFWTFTIYYYTGNTKHIIAEGTGNYLIAAQIKAVMEYVERQPLPQPSSISQDGGS